MIHIVTAFFDIGRGQWRAYTRSTDTYFRNFSRLCLLDNPIVLFTEEAHRERVGLYAHGKQNLTVVYLDDLFERHKDVLEEIDRIQNSEKFRANIVNPDCPEYNQPKYVLINYLKSFFCCEAIERFGLHNSSVAWIDFGYLRNKKQLPICLRWDYAFAPKINLFCLLPPQPHLDLVDIINHNRVYIQGCHIVAPATMWPLMARLMESALHQLMDNELIDDDQTLLLLSALAEPEHFELHMAQITKPLDWFFIFRKYNLGEGKINIAQRLRFWFKTIGRK